MPRWSLVVVALVVGSAWVAGEQPPLEAEKTVTFRTDTPIVLDVRVGPVTVSGVKVTVFDPGGIGASLKAKVSHFDPQTQTALHVAFDAENGTADACKVTYSVEFLDAKDAVVDRFTDKASYKNGAKTSTFDHVTLKALVPLIDKMRIKFQASLH